MSDETRHEADLSVLKQNSSTTPTAEKESDDSDSREHLHGLFLALLMISLCLTTFLVSLDRTIITTAIPQITADFSSTPDIGWYGSAYQLTSCAFQPLYGRAYQSFDVKWTYLIAVGMFELGSLICGVTPTSVGLIVGRAIQGLGNAGLSTGVLVIVAHAVSLEKRAVYNSIVMMMFTVGAICGPLIGGAFTDQVTWRWCFYLNLPVGGVTVLAVIVFFRPKSSTDTLRSFTTRVLELDLIGNAILLCSAVMFFLSLQYTETNYAWGSARVVGLLVGSGITILIFVFWQWREGENALIPLNIISQRSVVASCLLGFFIYSVVVVHAYYLPIWFQAIKGDDAVQSGVHMIPYTVAGCVSSLISGVLVSKTGYFTPPAIFGGAIATIGCGLLGTLAVDSGSSKWIGFEFLASFGAAMAIQQGYIAVEAALTHEDGPIGLAAMLACQSFGAALFVSVGNTILQDKLLAAGQNPELQVIDIPAIIRAGATQFRFLVPGDLLPALLIVYNDALQKVFYSAVPLAGLSFFSALFLEWRSVKDKPRPSNGDTQA